MNKFWLLLPVLLVSCSLGKNSAASTSAPLSSVSNLSLPTNGSLVASSRDNAINALKAIQLVTEGTGFTLPAKGHFTLEEVSVEDNWNEEGWLDQDNHFLRHFGRLSSRTGSQENRRYEWLYLKKTTLFSVTSRDGVTLTSDLFNYTSEAEAITAWQNGAEEVLTEVKTLLTGAARDYLAQLQSLDTTFSSLTSEDYRFTNAGVQADIQGKKGQDPATGSLGFLFQNNLFVSAYESLGEIRKEKVYHWGECELAYPNVPNSN